MGRMRATQVPQTAQAATTALRSVSPPTSIRTAARMMSAANT
jgi:hypothetical protein